MWSSLAFRERIQKSAVRYLLQRYLGQFLEERLTLDQLTIDLYNGTGSVSDVSLDVQAINKLGDQHNLPFEFVDGYISRVSVSVPWTTLLTDSNYVEVSGLELTVQPKQTEESETSMLESMWSSMSSSIQMATECLKQSEPENQGSDAPVIEGVEKFAHIIDSLLRRMKVKFVDTLIRLEHLPKGSKTGVAMEINIKHLDYCDEGESDTQRAPDAEFNPSSGFTVSQLHIEGVTFYSDEFPAEARTISRSLIVDSKSDETEPDISSKYESKPIIFAKLGGRQEVRLQLKKEEIQGPKVQGAKVDIELNLGSLSVFLSPRQLHLLLELCHGIAAPDIQDNSNVARCLQKPMGPKDFERVEQQLLNELHPVTTRGLHTVQGWSSAPLDDSDEEFFPMQGNGHNLSDSMFSDATSLNASFSSSCSSFSKTSTSVNSYNPKSSSAHKKKRRKSTRTRVDGDMGAEESRLHVKLSSLALVLLHEDILILSPETGQITESSLQQMSRTADQFFSKLGLFAATGYGKKDFEFARKIFVEACHLNHIRLLGAPVIMEIEERYSQSSTVVGAVLTAASVELLECLVEKVASNSQPLVEYVELLTFEEANPSREGASQWVSSQPDVRVQVKHMTKVRANMNARPRPPCTEISVILQNCTTEVDLSIVDRIYPVLNPRPLCTPATIQPGDIDLPGICQAMDLNGQAERTTDIKISSPELIIKMRFPIPDMRPVYDMDRPPWWKRNVRKDVMFIHLSDAVLGTCLNSTEASSNYDIKSKEATVFFQEGDTDVKVPLAYAQADEKTKPNEEGLLRLTVQVHPRVEFADLEEDTAPELPLHASMMQSLYIEPSKTDPSPFSSKLVAYESESLSDNDREELVIPGDREQMGQFIDSASRSAKLQVKINLPNVNIHLPSKHLYEVIYNRLNTDLSLWMPSPQVSSSNLTTSAPSSLYLPAFSMCKSAIQCDSDSESEDSENVFYSTWDAKPSLPQPYGQSKVTLSLNMGQATVSLLTNVKNTDSQDQGHLQLRVRDVSLFTVSGYKGTPQLNYVCVQVNKFSLDHCCELTESRCSYDLKRFSPHHDTHLEEVIYKTGAGSKVHRGGVEVGAGSDRSADMLTVAVRSQVNESRIKTVKVACGIRGATLRQRMTYSRHSWLLQLLDFFDVMDYPVAGYEPSQVITELHQHLWDCAIDYRPVHLPMRSLLAIGSLSISSNMAARTSCSTLRFIAEDTFLFLSNKTSSSVELRLDYVCVLDFGLFELTLRMSDNPRVHLRAFNNRVNIRTCSDSAQMLARLLEYVASYGDLEPIPTAPTPAPVPTSDNINNLSESTVLRVNQLMEDAMIDDPQHRKRTKSYSVQNAPEVEMFFFPDEAAQILQQESQDDRSQPSPDLSDSDFDDFVMIEHEAGSGHIPTDSYPVVRKLTDTPQVIIENHFSKPLRRTHDLEPPASFPKPVYNYELCEMTLQWHMYGGSDFQTSGPSHKKHVTISNESESVPSSPAYKRHFVDVNYSKNYPQEVVLNRRHSLDNQHHQDSPMNRPKNWWQRGGMGRDHDTLMELHLSKVQFHYHVYPEETKQASRQALAIKEVEICDKLRLSNINKFLYQYSSEQYPKSSRSNMVVVKANHQRSDLNFPHLTECSLYIQLKPLRFNIDQDSLLFLINFVSEISDFSDKKEVEAVVPASPRHVPPVMAVEGERVATPPPTPPPPQLLIMLNEPEDTSEKGTTTNIAEDSSPSSPIYFKLLRMNAVLIKLDYMGKHVDMTHGPLAGLLMGLTQLNNTELWLTCIYNNKGLLGFEKLIRYVQNQWADAIREQVPRSLLTGIGPMNSVAHLFWGLRDLFWLPIEQYQRDGRVIRGLQRGAHSFSTSTCLACLELTTRLVHVVQSVAETTFDMVSPGPSVRRRKHKRGNKIRSRNTPPADFREGITNAVALVKEGIGETAQTLVQEALAEHEDKGAFGAVGGVLRQIPPTIVTPIILASAATSNLLGGVRSQLVPDTRREAALKWRDQDNP